MIPRTAALFWLLLTLSAAAQWYPFQRYGLELGLSDSSVLALAQDSRGFVWIGTAGGGLLRYDGMDFVPFSNRRTAIPRTITAVCTAGSELYIGTDSGMKVLRLRADAKDSLDARATAKASVIRGRIHALQKTPDGRIHVRTESGMWYVDIRNGVVVRSRDSLVFTVRRPAATFAGMSRAVARDGSGRFWYATDRGLLCEDAAQSMLYDPMNGLDMTDLYCVLADREGSIWCGGVGGLRRISPGRTQVFAPGAGLPLETGTVLRSAFGPDGSMWFCTSSGLWRWKAGRISLFASTGRIPGGVQHVIPRGPDQLLFGSWMGLTLMDQQRSSTLSRAQGLPSDTITALLESSRGGFWIGTPEGLVRWKSDTMRMLTIRDGLPSNFVSHIAEDASGDVWVATPNGACLISRAANEEVIHLKQFSGIDIVSVFVDRQNNAWFGTSNDGVYSLRVDGILHLTHRDGLAADHVTSIAQDRHGTLYLGTPRGISALPEANVERYMQTDSSLSWHQQSVVTMLPFLRMTGMFPVGTAQDLPAPAIMRNGMYGTTSGPLFITTAGGVAVFSPRAPGTRDSSVPRIILHEVRIGDRETNQKGTLILAPDEEVVRVHVLLPTYRNPGQRRYIYRLDGFEYVWHESNDGRIVLSGLSPGSYQLVIRAGIGEGVWTEDLTLDIEMRSALSDSIFFKALALLMAAALGYAARASVLALRQRPR